MTTTTQQPVFATVNGNTYLMDHHNHPAIFTTRFSAIMKLAELKGYGHNVELEPLNTFYRIKLVTA